MTEPTNANWDAANRIYTCGAARFRDDVPPDRARRQFAEIIADARAAERKAVRSLVEAAANVQESNLSADSIIATYRHLRALAAGVKAVMGDTTDEPRPRCCRTCGYLLEGGVCGYWIGTSGFHESAVCTQWLPRVEALMGDADA